MMLKNLPEETGLGYLDTSKAILELEMEIKRLEEPSDISEGSQLGRRRGRKKAVEGVRPIVVPISIQQDLGMLKGRTGDTGEYNVLTYSITADKLIVSGSVLWRSRYVWLALH